MIVSTHPDRDTPNPPYAANAHDDGDEFTKPLVVLVNQYSASASEIVSGALKDQHRAILVGERTFGKGSVQQLFQLPPDDESIIKLTTSHYYLPSGRCIHREENSTTWGVDPDVTVALTPEQMSAAQLARRKMDVYHAAVSAPAAGDDAKLRAMAPAVTDAPEVGRHAHDRAEHAAGAGHQAEGPARRRPATVGRRAGAAAGTGGGAPLITSNRRTNEAPGLHPGLCHSSVSRQQQTRAGRRT